MWMIAHELRTGSPRKPPQQSLNYQACYSMLLSNPWSSRDRPTRDRRANMRRLFPVLLSLFLLACDSSPSMNAPTAATSTPTIPAPATPTPLLAPTATASPASDVMCEMDTECFWQAYQRCATLQRARLAVLLAGPTLVHGDTVTRWRNIFLGHTSGICDIQVADQTSAVLSNGNVAGAPGPSYRCINMTREPSGTLHVTGCI